MIYEYCFVSNQRLKLLKGFKCRRVPEIEAVKQNILMIIGCIMMYVHAPTKIILHGRS